MSLRQVAQDAVRAAYGDALADELDCAAGVLQHLETVRAALIPDAQLGCRAIVTLVPGHVLQTPGVPRCSARVGHPHYPTCPNAALLRVLDPQWAEAELQAAWTSALRHAQHARLLHRRPDLHHTLDADETQIALANTDPDELRMLLRHAATAVGDIVRIRLPDGRVFEGRPNQRPVPFGE